MGETLDRIDPAVGNDVWGVFLADVSTGLYASKAWLDLPDC